MNKNKNNNKKKQGKMFSSLLAFEIFSNLKFTISTQGIHVLLFVVVIVVNWVFCVIMERWLESKNYICEMDLRLKNELKWRIKEEWASLFFSFLNHSKSMDGILNFSTCCLSSLAVNHWKLQIKAAKSWTSSFLFWSFLIFRTTQQRQKKIWNKK